MKKHFIQYKDQKIAIFTKGDPSSYPIVMLHGNSLSSFTFKNQFNQPDFKNYYLVSMDLLGHGDSERAGKSAEHYSFNGVLKQISYVISQLKISKPTIVGNSLGGHLALHYHSETKNTNGLMICGTPPLTSSLNLEEAMLPNPDIDLAFKAEHTADDRNKLSMLLTGRQDPDINALLKKSDPLFRSSFVNSLSTEPFEDETMIVRKMDVPLYIFQSEKETVANLEYIKELKMPNLFENKIHVHPEGSHCPQYTDPKVFNNELKRFINHLK